MSFNKNQFKDLVERVLEKFGFPSAGAVNLLLGTAAQESHFGTYLRQIRGPAKGVFQMEPATEYDIWENYLKARPHLIEKIKKVSGVIGPDPDALECNLAYQIIMTRLHYRRRPEALPAADAIDYMAEYWKKYYNTPAGAGTEEEFKQNYRNYVL